MQREYKRYSKLRDNAKTVTLNKIKDIEIGNGLKASIVPTPPYLQISLFSQEVFEKTGSDVAFFLNKDGKISIRRNNENIDCGAIAKQLLDGGGHKFAAGGKLKSNHENMDEIEYELKEAVTKAIKNSY
jgi:oligoribonuclease NrnB/cAMP/cGMP phosphodiesterase (DHH superfamily)